MTLSGLLVHVNGVQRTFQASMKDRIVAMRSAMVGKLPRCSAWRVMTEKNALTMFSQNPEAGVKCSVTRGRGLSQRGRPDAFGWRSYRPPRAIPGAESGGDEGDVAVPAGEGASLEVVQTQAGD